MAGDWIKMRENLHEDPAVLMMAKSLETRPEHVVGYCHRFWSWASRNCVPDLSPEDGDKCPDSVPINVPLVALESVLNLPGFLQMLVEVGWLKYVENGSGSHLTIPKFDRHLSESAKRRALAAEKKRLQRVPKVSPTTGDKCPPKTGTREEKRREEEIREEGTKRGRSHKAFTKPTVEEVAAYATELGYTMDSGKFWHYYNTRGWRTKEGPMQSWKSAVVNWQKNEGNFGNDRKRNISPGQLFDPAVPTNTSGKFT